MDSNAPILSPAVVRTNSRSADVRPVNSPRRITRGPLDLDYVPSIGSPTLTADTGGNDSSTLLSPALSRVMSPVSSGTTLVVDNLKDYSYLTEPQTFRPVPHLDLPEPIRARTQPPTSTPIPSLLLSSHLRAAAITAANDLTACTPYDYKTIFELWFIRLSCLSLISPATTLIAAQEIKVFGDLTSSFYRDAETNAHVVPWELRVLAIRLQALGFNDWRRCLEHFYLLAKEARGEAARTEAGGEERQMWKRRLWDLGIRVGSALIEMGDLDGAARHLEGMIGGVDAKKGDDEKVSFMLALLYVLIGNIKAARACFSSVSTADASASNRVIEAFCLMGDNDFAGAIEVWRQLEQEDSSNRVMISQNLAVCLLYTGRLTESKTTLEKLVDSDKMAFHSLTFNLCTLYELCSDDARTMKTDLAAKVAEMGKEMTNVSFKL